METEFCVLDVDHVLEGESPVIRIWGRTEDGKSVLATDREFYPYFYLDVSDDLLKEEGIANLRERILRIGNMGGKYLDIRKTERNLLGEGKSLLRVTIQNPVDIPKLRHVVEDWKGVKKAYEYDITFYRRYMIDRGISPMMLVRVEGEEKGTDFAVDRMIEIKSVSPVREDDGNFRSLAFDIETIDEKIIMISYFTSEGKNGVLTHGWNPKKKGGFEVSDSEEGMIRRFVEIINETDPDMVITYNGDVFDFHKLRNRADHYKVPLKMGRDGSVLAYTKRGRVFSSKITGRVHVDLYDFVERILGDSLSSETFTLDMVSREILGSGKIRMDWKSIEEAWKKKRGMKRVADYCLRDSELTLRLSERLLSRITELSRLVGQTLFDTNRMTYSQLVEWMLIRKAFGKREVVMNRPRYDEIRSRRKAAPYTGGYVYPPEPGIHTTVSLFDFTSLYPSIIITHNVSPETLDKGEKEKKNTVPGGEHYFDSKGTGFVPEILEELLKKRKDVKKRMKEMKEDSDEYRDLYSRQYALKIIANASYGYYAYAGSRWYSRICAKSIAAWGRFYIQKVIEFAKNRNFRVIYGDTDSLFLERCSRGKAKSFVREINKELPETMELEFVKSYRSGLFVHTKTGTTAKKRYALLDNDGNILVRGFEKVRRDWSKLAKDTQEKVLEAILKDNDQNKAVNIVETVIERLRKGEVEMEELVIYTQITKPLEQYEAIGPHVSAAKKFVRKGHSIKPGQVIGYVVTKGMGTISNRAEPVEYAENYDPEYYIENQIVPAAMRILNAVGLEEGELGADEDGQQSLNSFMKKSLRKKIKEKWIGRKKGCSGYF